MASTCCVGTLHCQGTISYYNPTSRHLAIDMGPVVHTEATFVGLYGALFLVMLPLLYTSWYAVHLTTASAGESCAHVLMSGACFLRVVEPSGAHSRRYSTASMAVRRRGLSKHQR